jgi:hypothetical protein
MLLAVGRAFCLFAFLYFSYPWVKTQGQRVISPDLLPFYTGGKGNSRQSFAQAV